CGRGGTGRRAGLRSLFSQESGSSILLVRTNHFPAPDHINNSPAPLTLAYHSLYELSRLDGTRGRLAFGRRAFIRVYPPAAAHNLAAFPLFRHSGQPPRI